MTAHWLSATVDTPERMLEPQKHSLPYSTPPNEKPALEQVVKHDEMLLESVEVLGPSKSVRELTLSV